MSRPRLRSSLVDKGAGMNQNGKHRNVAVVDRLEDPNPTADATEFLNLSDPVLQPAKEVEPRRGSWKRKLIGAVLLLLLIGGGIGALYFLLRINRVNVRVQGDAPRQTQGTKSNNDGQESENAAT